MNDSSLEISVSAIAGFSGDGRVFRAFGHLLGVGNGGGTMFLVPLGRSHGDLRQVTDGCPVPWHEVVAVIDTPPTAAAPQLPETMCAHHPALALLTPYGWLLDRIAINPGDSASIERLTHVSGLRFARVAP